MIARGTSAVCINVQSFGDLIKLLASSLSWGSDSAATFRKGQQEVPGLHFLPLDFHRAAKVLSSEKVSTE